MSLLSVSVLSDSSSALVEGGVTVDLDASLFVQLGLFLILLLVLKPTLFDPMMRLFEEREKRIEGTRHKASKEDERSAKALAKYEGLLAEARLVGSRERDQLRTEGLKREAELMNQVRSEVASTLDQGRSAIAQEADAARRALRGDAAAIARQMATRVLGREVAS